MDSINIVSAAFQLTLLGSLYVGPLAASSLSLAFSRKTWILYTGKFADWRDIQKHSNLKGKVK